MSFKTISHSILGIVKDTLTFLAQLFDGKLTCYFLSLLFSINKIHNSRADQYIVTTILPMTLLCPAELMLRLFLCGDYEIYHPLY